VSWFERLWADWYEGFWKMIPHRFDTYRGSPLCGRCGVHWKTHRGTRKD